MANRRSSWSFVLALGFGKDPDDAARNAVDSLHQGFDTAKWNYSSGWTGGLIASVSIPLRFRETLIYAARGGMIAQPWETHRYIVSYLNLKVVVRHETSDSPIRKCIFSGGWYGSGSSPADRRAHCRHR